MATFLGDFVAKSGIFLYFATFEPCFVAESGKFGHFATFLGDFVAESRIFRHFATFEPCFVAESGKFGHFATFLGDFVAELGYFVRDIAENSAVWGSGHEILQVSHFLSTVSSIVAPWLTDLLKLGGK